MFPPFLAYSQWFFFSIFFCVIFLRTYFPTMPVFPRASSLLLLQQIYFPTLTATTIAVGNTTTTSNLSCCVDLPGHSRLRPQQLAPVRLLEWDHPGVSGGDVVYHVCHSAAKGRLVCPSSRTLAEAPVLTVSEHSVLAGGRGLGKWRVNSDS